jgi:hypothetical protein
MTTSQISMSLIVAFLMVPFRHLQADETIHLTAEEVINIVSQKLDVAQSRKDARALRAAKDNLPAISSGYGKKVYRHLAPEQTFALELKILQVADRMQDKSYDHTIRPKAGWYGDVPWPPENERPEALRDIPLWWPRTSPEYYKERDPELYAFYKPLYEENLRNTKKHQYEGGVRVVREDMLRDTRGRLKFECDRGAESRNFSLYLRLVDEIIEDKQLRDEILSDIPPERRLPETPSKEKSAP